MTDSKQAWEVGTANRSPHAKNDWYAVVFDNTKNGKPHHPRAAEVYGMSKVEAAEKAHLVAAAPDMLEALRGLLETSPPPKGVRLDYSYLLYREAARTAIAKAIGRDQMDL
jgi:hypothetical protein